MQFQTWIAFGIMVGFICSVWFGNYVCTDNRRPWSLPNRLILRRGLESQLEAHGCQPSTPLRRPPPMSFRLLL